MKTLLTAAAAIATVLIPSAAAFASTYAYVNTAGEVMTTDAASADQALMSAPSISMHSGVMIIDSTDDSAVLGDKVSGT